MSVLVGAMLFVGALAGPQLSVNGYGACATWWDQVKCWGYNEMMDAAYVAGENMTAVPLPPATSFDLGSVDGDFAVSQVISGGNLNCAISVEGAVRCWGDEWCLGYGNDKLYFRSRLSIFSEIVCVPLF